MTVAQNAATTGLAKDADLGAKTAGFEGEFDTNQWQIRLGAATQQLFDSNPELFGIGAV
jgi:hypothetical protein